MIYFLILGVLIFFCQIRVLYAFVAAIGFASFLWVFSHPRFSFYYLNAYIVA